MAKHHVHVVLDETDFKILDGQTKAAMKAGRPEIRNRSDYIRMLIREDKPKPVKKTS